MNLHLIAIGKLKKGGQAELSADYAERIRKSAPQARLKSLRIHEIDEARASSAAERKRREATAVANAIPAGATIIALDETGKSVASRKLAADMSRHRDNGIADLAFVIGGPDGLDPDFVKSAHQTLAFGQSTWPHQLVRVMLLEQIYRAITILTNHPYHRD